MEEYESASASGSIPDASSKNNLGLQNNADDDEDLHASE